MCAAHHLTEAEVGDDERGVGLDVGAHHQDVARLERRVVGQQPEQHLPQHVDLPGRAVAAVDLYGPVVVGQHAAGRTDRVGGQVGLQPAEQGIPAVRLAERLVGRGIGGQASLQLTQITTEGGQQWVPHLPMAGVFATRHGAMYAGECPPQSVAGVRQPQMQIVVDGDRLE